MAYIGMLPERAYGEPDAFDIYACYKLKDDSVAYIHLFQGTVFVVQHRMTSA